MLYYAFVSTKLEYGPSVWRLNYKIYINLLENGVFLKSLYFKANTDDLPVVYPQYGLLESFLVTLLGTVCEYFSLLLYL